MDTKKALETASAHLFKLDGHILDVLDVKKPVSPDAAVNLAKIISKLSPLLGNLIEFNTVEILNEKEEFNGLGKWKRQDPGFPDAIFQGTITPTPGFEIKAWFPMATELTARFKDSQNRFKDENTKVAILAWLPENLIYGKPRILSVCIADGLSVAKARDTHYHNPPDYLVLEPHDTTARTSNLQQTNTSGHKWQGTGADFAEAVKLVEGWGAKGREYLPTPEYQTKLRELTSKYPYRLDTNYSKMDRIGHTGIEAFITKIYGTKVQGMTVKEWKQVLKPVKEKAVNEDEEEEVDEAHLAKIAKRDAEMKAALKEHLKITEDDAETLVE